MATEQNKIISRKGDSLSPVRKRAFNVALYNRQKENLLAKKIKTQLSNTTHFF